jgi:hypothetical protein
MEPQEAIVSMDLKQAMEAQEEIMEAQGAQEEI